MLTSSLQYVHCALPNPSQFIPVFPALPRSESAGRNEGSVAPQTGTYLPFVARLDAVPHNFSGGQCPSTYKLLRYAFGITSKPRSAWGFPRVLVSHLHPQCSPAEWRRENRKVERLSLPLIDSHLAIRIRLPMYIRYKSIRYPKLLSLQQTSKSITPNLDRDSPPSSYKHAMLRPEYIADMCAQP